jgi:glutamate dehydrogenase (NAD(P)+)
MVEALRYTDNLGPAKVLQIYEPSFDLRAIVVVDNVAAGPAIGGLRMAQDVSAEECFRLARAMTFKNAAAGLAHGGGKSVLFGDPRSAQKEQLVRAFACAIRDIGDYIPGPDMGTDERAMAWIKDEIGRAVGLPREIGGIPLDEIGATGWGLAAAAEVGSEFCELDLAGARVAVQGFGSVGIHVARFLADKGAVLVAAADSQGTLVDPSGLDIAALTSIKAEGGSLVDHDGGLKLEREAVIEADCDIWIPAARSDVVRQDNADRLRARLVVQGANIAVTEDAERRLHERGVLSIPDFIANAGGVICAAVEYRQGTEAMAMQTIEEKVRANTHRVLAESREHGMSPRAAAMAMARRRVLRAMAYRRRP